MAVVDYQSSKTPIASRINYRLLIVIGVFASLVAVPVYSLVQAQMNHGIQRSGSEYKVDLKQLGNFEFNEMTGTINDVPEQYRKLDGKEVALEGFMYAGSGAGDRVNGFQFVYNIQKCCFGGPPRVQERVFAIANGDGIPLVGDEIRIVGTLHVALHRDKATGKVLTVYMMDVHRAEPL